MSVLRSERQLAVILANKLHSHYGYEVFRNVNPASANFREYWAKWFSGEPLLPQPDVDLLVVDLGDLIAIELKYIVLSRQKGRRILKRRYYEGIGQVLALLRYGFERVQLWHCFDESIDVAHIARFLENTYDLIYKLKLPIGYAALRVVEDQGEVLLKEIHRSYGDPPLFEYDHPPDPRRFKASNPLCEEREAKRVREFIEHILRIPRA